MRHFPFRAALVLIAIGGLSALARGTVINIDFNGLRSGDTQGPTYSGTGAAGDAGTVFNGLVADSTAGTTASDNITVAGTNLLTSTGTATSTAFSITPVGGDNNGAGSIPPATSTNSNALFFDYVFNNSAGNTSTANFTITGLAASSPATLYFYTSQTLNGLTVTGGTSVTFTPTGVFNTANTKEFTVTTSATGTIAGSLGAGTNVLSGLTVNVVPEPASLSLLGLAGLGLLTRRRPA